MDISKARPSTEAQNNGVWVDYDEETRFKVRSTESPEYTRAVQKHTRRLSPAQQKQAGLMKQIVARCMAEAIIVDWEGVTDSDKKLAVTEENKAKLVEIPEIRDFIADASQEHANFQQENLEADASAVKSGD